ncbi:PqqD family protein, partial [Dorea formicigenerans]|uniref:PqqD family protein n=1 Tax=Dorea formicigenerans TaxID=39486 RepID=UPI001EDF0E4A
RPDVTRVSLPDGGAVILYRDGQTLVVLNSSAHYLWRILARGDRACLSAALMSRFGLSPEQAQTDSAAVVDGWIARGLVSDAAGMLLCPE